ncbi:MAG: lipid-A-disaccharide synthase [Thermoanaerobaculum sp.]|nr:lipid-A-disaccharide synthase [Thermoanaerobaculum sp.]
MLRLFLSATETSADQLGANLLAQLQKRTPLEVVGVGGERLRVAGLKPVAWAEELSLMGLVEVLGDLPRLWRVFRRVKGEALAFQPDVAVLIDGPDFHLPLSRHLARAGVPVVMYVSPQLWAWRPWRVRRIRQRVRKVLCILPFEVAFYQEHGVDACFVGHPLMDELAPVAASLPMEREHAIALLPGSRRHEVRALLPIMVAALQRLQQEDPSILGKIIVAPGLSAEELGRMAAGLGFSGQVVRGDEYQQIASCCAAWVASGTATLVCALLDVPMVVTYRVHPITYAMAKRLVKIPYVGLVNLVAGELVAPELLQDSLTVDRLAQVGGQLLAQEGERQRRKLAVVRQHLGPGGASQRAAEEILRVVGR